MEDYITVSAKTLDDAITEALVQLGVTSDRLDYIVVEKGSEGFLGIGRKQAVIKARRKREEKPVEETVEESKVETPVKEEVKEIEVQEPADTTEETNELYAPMKGEVLDVAKSADPAFASKAMGEGVAINPSEGIVYAPADGTISLIFPTKHAMGITLNSGVELLIHAGIDTVKMNGEGFETFVETGAKVKKGDKLLSFDMDLVKEKGYKTQTMFLVADAKGKEVEVVETADADNNTKIMNLK